MASSAAFFFILATPFLVFLEHHRYSWLRADAALCLLAFAVAAAVVGVVGRRWKYAEPVLLAWAVTFFVDVQFDVLNNGPALLAAFVLLSAVLVVLRAHAAQVLAVVGGVMFAATLLVPQSARPTAPAVPAASSSAGRLPFFLHIVLDEHIGLEGLENANGGGRLRDELRSFFLRQGFLLFGSAYSEHFNTFRSLSHELNFSPARHRPELYSHDGGEHVWRLNRNEYFRGLVSSGYRMRVYQSNFLNVCADPAAPVSCETYDYTGVGELQSAPVTMFEKAWVLFSVYLIRTHTLGELAFQYGKIRRQLLAWGIEAPVWRNFPGALSPLVTMRIVRALASDIERAERGTYIFAHLLMPHAPYLFDAGCNVLPPADWLNRNAAAAPVGRTNTRESREARYSRYIEQVRCVYRQLDDLLGRIRPDLKDDAIIIVQGDHGSRITIADPVLANAASLSEQDFADGYSTLFAVRAPGLPAGYDEAPVPLTCLLESFVESGYRDVSTAAGCASPQVVFLSDGNDRVEARPYR